MGDKSSIVFDHIKTYVGYYLSIIAVIGSLWAIFGFYEKWRDEKTLMRNEIKILIQEKNDHRKIDSVLMDEQYILQSRLNAIESKSDIQGKDIKSVKSSVLRYMSQDEALTKVDFIRFVQEINGDSTIIYQYPYLLPKNKAKKSK